MGRDGLDVVCQPAARGPLGDLVMGGALRNVDPARVFYIARPWDPASCDGNYSSSGSASRKGL